MNRKPDLAERLGKSLNELDIDFSQLTLVGWLVSVISFLLGGGLAFLAANALVQRNGLNLAAGMTFCFTILAVGTVAFRVLRWAAHSMGLPTTKHVNRQPPGPKSNVGS